MQLKRAGREYYELAIAAVDASGNALAAASWQASFDGGTNYLPCIVITHDVDDPPAGDFSAWLIAGPDAAQGTAVAKLTTSTTPIVRYTANPEIIVRDAPRIQVV